MAAAAPIRISRTISRTFPQNPPKSSHVDATTMERILIELRSVDYNSIYEALKGVNVPVEGGVMGPLTQEQKDWFFNKIPEPPITEPEEEKIIDEIIPLVNNVETQTTLRRSTRARKPVIYKIIDDAIDDEYDEAYIERDVEKRVRKRNNALNKNIKRRKVTKTQSPPSGSGSNTQLSIIHEVGTLLCYFHPQLMELNVRHPSFINIDAFKSSFGAYSSTLNVPGGMNFDELCAELFNSLEGRTEKQLYKLTQAIESAQALRVNPMYNKFTKGAWVNTAGRFKAVTGHEHLDNPADIVFTDGVNLMGISLKASFDANPITIYNGGITKTVTLFGLGPAKAKSIQGIYDTFNRYWLELTKFKGGNQSAQKKHWKQHENNELSQLKIDMLGNVNNAFTENISSIPAYKIAAAFFRYPVDGTPINVPYVKLSALGLQNVHIDDPKDVLIDILKGGGVVSIAPSGNTAMIITIKTGSCYHRFHFRIKTASSPPSAIKINVIYLGSSKTQKGGNSYNLSLLAPDEVVHYNILYSFLDEYSELDIVNGDILEESLDAIHGSIDINAVAILDVLYKMDYGRYTDSIRRDIRHLARYINALIRSRAVATVAGVAAAGAAGYGSGGTYGGKKQRKKATTRKRKRTHKKRIRKNKTSRKNKRHTKRKSRKAKK